MSRRRRHGPLFICAMAILGPAYWVTAGTLWFAWHAIRFMSFLVFGRPQLVRLGGLHRALTSWLGL